MKRLARLDFLAPMHRGRLTWFILGGAAVLATVWPLLHV